MSTSLMKTNRDLMSTTPAGTLEAQAGIADWCEHKITELNQQHREAMENYEQAKEHKWKSSPFLRHAKRLDGSITYYRKIRECIRRGYVIIPNFACDQFAVRTKMRAPGGHKREKSHWSVGFRQQGKGLPEGEGQWVNPFPYTEEWTEGEGDEKKTYHRPVEHDTEIVFPVTAVKPALLNRAQAVMAEELFDELAVTTEEQPCGDPILLGRITHPTRKLYGGTPRAVTFFVGWWLNLEDI